jgi:type III secretory pathway component EscR
MKIKKVDLKKRLIDYKLYIERNGENRSKKYFNKNKNKHNRNHNKLDKKVKK